MTVEGDDRGVVFTLGGGVAREPQGVVIIVEVLMSLSGGHEGL